MAPGNDQADINALRSAVENLQKSSMPRELLEEKLDRIGEGQENQVREQEKTNEHLGALNGTVSNNKETLALLMQWREAHCQAQAIRDKKIDDEFARLDRKVNWFTGIQVSLTAIAGGLIALITGGNS